MPVGRMRHKIQIQSKVTTSDGGGSEAVSSWSTFATIQASISGGSGGERLFGEQLQEPITHEFRIRFRRDVSFKNRIKYAYVNDGNSNTRFFNITRVINVDSKDKYLDLQCVEGVAT